MPDSILEEYKAYYHVRAERYANNPNYKYSYEAEKKPVRSHAVMQ